MSRHLHEKDRILTNVCFTIFPEIEKPRKDYLSLRDFTEGKNSVENIRCSSQDQVCKPKGTFKNQSDTRSFKV